MAKITVIANQKGGIGKTTTANALSAGLKDKGFDVLSIDADPQGNLSHTMKADTESKGLFEALNGENISELIRHTPRGDIITSSSQLTGADKKFTEYGSEYLLREALEEVKEKYQYIIIDSPPQLGILTINTLIAADSLIIPCTSDLYAMMGLSQLLNTVERVKKHGNANLIIDGILLTRYAARSVLSRSLKETLETKSKEMGTKLYSAVIRESISIREAQTARKDIFDYAPKSNAAADYNNFIDEYLNDERKKTNGK